MALKNLPIIGSTELVSIDGHIDVPAKIDTGADTSSIWASNIIVTPDGVLKFSLFGPGSPYYTGKILEHTVYQAAVVRSATGEEQIRYQTYLSLKIAGRRIRVRFNLSDRSRNNFPILIGKRTLKNRFLVDVQRSAIGYSKKLRSGALTSELRKDPYAFHQRYYQKLEPPSSHSGQVHQV